MQAIFIRHASAEPAGAGGDAARRLTDAGRAEARATAEALRAMGLRVQAVLTSPLARARETAEIVAAVHGTPPAEPADCLAPPGDAALLARLLRELAADGTSVAAVVGHTPSLEACATAMVDGKCWPGMSLSKAGAAEVHLPAPGEEGCAELRWMLRRDQLAMLARQGGR